MHFNGLFDCIILFQIVSSVVGFFKFPMPGSLRQRPITLEEVFMRQYKALSTTNEEYLNFQQEVIDAVTDIKDEIDLRGLYATLKYHPTLMDRRLQIGRSPPPLPPVDTNFDTGHQFQKRSNDFDLGLAEPSCPFRTEWVRLRHAIDMNNTRVQVFQPSDNSNKYQWFYTVTCDQETLVQENENCPYCCRATNTRRYSTRCISRQSYVMALIRHSSHQDYDWGYIQVDSSCNCAFIPKH